MITGGWLESVQWQVAYNEWANNQLLRCASTLDNEKLRAAVMVSRGSVGNALHHILNSQVWWLSVLESRAHEELTALGVSAIPAELQRHAAASHERLREHVASLTETTLRAEVAYTTKTGEQHCWARWQILEHVANHGAQHRGEVGMALAALGRPPGDIDFLDYLAARDSR